MVILANAGGNLNQAGLGQADYTKAANIYLREDTVMSRRPCGICVHEDKYISVCGSINRKHFNWTKPFKKFLPSLRPYSISQCQHT